MARRKRSGDVKSILIELDLGDPQQKAVWENWQEMSERGQASDWARVALIRALMPSTPKPAVSFAAAAPAHDKPATPVTRPMGQQTYAVPKPGTAKPKGEVRRVPVDEE